MKSYDSFGLILSIWNLKRQPFKCKYSPQYSSSAKIWGGNACLGSWSLIVAPLFVDFSCMNSFSLSLPGSVISTISYLMFLLSRIIRTRCCRFLTWNRKECTWLSLWGEHFLLFTCSYPNGIGATVSILFINHITHVISSSHIYVNDINQPTNPPEKRNEKKYSLFLVDG